MAVDIKAKIEEIVAKVTSDKTLLEKFKKDPAATVKSLLKVDLSEDVLEKIVAGVKAKIGTDKLSGLLGGLFGKK